MKYRHLALAGAFFLAPVVALAQTATPPATKPAAPTTTAPDAPAATTPDKTKPATPGASNSSETPAVTTPDSTNPSAPVEGENSFTEEQAKKRFEDAGYTDVTGLTLTDKGIWEGSAMYQGSKVTVQLDYQGNITKKAM